ncbi:ABC transporter substrate-binding protein [Rhizobium paknamense]|uniref:Alpha-1,4-digalacturonate transport system substrate-binding protein n=1 Tax=Rhizobium paknamense TaxID=1206817 RepID=A0ABU0IDT6_9HYPH|nr:extracellular solute-binding protein [Rhizobium paknamense]MDQ0455857.1 alpha-1,4-digalacturonate transport system substrate-binding protein [Rhizobium paknamense]
MSMTKLASAAALATLMMMSSAAASQLKLVWYVEDDTQEKALKTLLDKYTASHPETTFDLQITPYDGMLQKFQQYAASGIMPDLSLTSSMEPVIRPFLADLSKEIGPDWINDFVKGWADGAKLGDQVIAAPLNVTSTGVFLNTDAFKKAGVEIPSQDKGWTWDEFTARIKDVSQKSGTRYPMVWDVSASRFIVYPFQYGNHIFSEKEPVKVVMDDAAWTKSVDDFVKLTKDVLPPGLWSGASSDNPKELFLNGQAVAYMSGSWQIPALAGKAKFGWQAGPTPAGTVRSSIYGGDYLVAFNTSPHLKEAVDFIKWITSPDVQADYAKTFGVIPANKKAAKVDYGNEAASMAVKTMQGELDASPAYAATDQAWPQMQPVWAVIKPAITQAVAGQISAAEAVSEIHKAAEEAVEAGQ